MALDQQRGIEREGRKSREPAEDPGGQEQARVLTETGPEGEIPRQEAHQERTGDVDDQRSERKAVAEQPGRADVDAMSQRTADTRSEKDDQVKHRPPTAAKSRLQESSADRRLKREPHSLGFSLTAPSFPAKQLFE